MGDFYEEQDLLLRIIRLMVRFPEQASVERTTDERGVLLTIKVAAVDRGFVIGRGGETARAIRKIFASFGKILNSHISMVIWESEEERAKHEAAIQASLKKPMTVEETFSDENLKI